MSLAPLVAMGIIAIQTAIDVKLFETRLNGE